MNTDIYFSEARVRDKPTRKLFLKLGDGSVTEDKLSNGSVTTSKVRDKSITADKLSDGIIENMTEIVADNIPIITAKEIDGIVNIEEEYNY